MVIQQAHQRGRSIALEILMTGKAMKKDNEPKLAPHETKYISTGCP
jgi:hypothetical protein